mmetsp:Transcript_27813/g.60433  ORF Transcript_27813/g.60433 Transcript_27813/m.60433 type:complete len:211 (-) Transcript_27813:6-638(-)
MRSMLSSYRCSSSSAGPRWLTLTPRQRRWGRYAHRATRSPATPPACSDPAATSSAHSWHAPARAGQTLRRAAPPAPVRVAGRPHDRSGRPAIAAKRPARPRAVPPSRPPASSETPASSSHNCQRSNCLRRSPRRRRRQPGRECSGRRCQSQNRRPRQHRQQAITPWSGAACPSHHRHRGHPGRRSSCAEWGKRASAGGGDGPCRRSAKTA